MNTPSFATTSSSVDLLWRRANLLALITIFYNLLEGIVSVWFGTGDGSSALLGFGIDSFVEVISGIGVWHMIRRQRQEPDAPHDDFERRALRITGRGFYLLAAGLTGSSLFNLATGHRPETTFWGIVISAISILTMWLLIRAKVTVGKLLDSPAILADAACTRTCLALSFILLGASIGYEVTGIAGLDAVGGLGIAWFSLKEGREAFATAKGLACGCSCGKQKGP
jgi:divalent metal cation (Fe/Co/Zn/Cd) transporter